MKSAIEFSANGKLLIAGEYLVLAGATALALPVRFGQRMELQKINSPVMEWESSSPAGTWFKASFDPDILTVISASDPKIARKLQILFLLARLINRDFLTGSIGWKVKVTANYPLEWGLGSSSTLCSLVARWANVDPFFLLNTKLKGSGYDIACATSSEMLYYRKRKDIPEITVAKPGKAIRENTWFAYLGNKQDSALEVASFLKNQNYNDNDLAEVSRLSTAICEARSPEELITLVDEHEILLGKILKREPIANRFPSFPGTVKSLGAWGGDFAMFVSGLEPEAVVDQLHGLGFFNVFSFNDLKINS